MARPGRRPGLVLVGVVGGVVVAAAALSRSPGRRGRHRPERPGWWSAAFLGPLAASWLALGIVDSIAGAIGGLVSKPVDWARSMIQGVVSWITDWVNHVIDWAGQAFGAIDGVLSRLWDFGNSIITWAHGLMIDVYDRLVGWVGGLIRDVRNWVTGWVNRVIDWVSGLVGDLWAYAHNIVDWVNRNVWQPLWDRIEGAIGWIQTSVIPWLGRLVDDLRGWAGSAFDHLWGWIADQLQPWIRWAETLLHAVERAWGWLVWIGDHPLDWFRTLWRDWTHLGTRDVTEGVIAALSSESDMVADHLIRWLG